MERKSTRTPVTEAEIRKAIDIAKAPIIAASEAADVAVKATMWEAGKDMLHSFANSSERMNCEIETSVPAKRNMDSKQNISQSKTRRKKNHIFDRIVWTIVILAILTYFGMALCVMIAAYYESV